MKPNFKIQHVKITKQPHNDSYNINIDEELLIMLEKQSKGKEVGIGEEKRYFRFL